jgi:hypothetical protein
VYELSRTVLVNEAGKSFLSRHDVWTGLVMKAHNALPYVPQMQKCEVLEQGLGWLIRDILLNDVPLREKVSFEPEERVSFERIGGPEAGRIENVIGEDPAGNLTLTFSFALTKEGLVENSQAERDHFAPMEKVYLGAVAATLAAVRRTVDDQGREKLPLASPIDAVGDNAWIYEYYRSADSLDLERLVAHHAEDTRLTFANYPTVYGKDGFRAVIGGLWKKIKGMSHSISGAWSLHNGQVGIAELICLYTRLDDSLYTIKACTVLRRREGKVTDMRIHADVTEL